MAPSRLFLERRTYRMRRLMDAVRMLPVLGLLLWMVPLLWPTSATMPVSAPGPDAVAVSTGSALRFIFGVWLGLIGLALVLWLRSRHAINRPEISDMARPTVPPEADP